MLCLLTYCFLCVIGSCPEAPSATSPTPLPMQRNLYEEAHAHSTRWSTQHMLFIVDLMRLHLEREGEGLPKSMKDLNSRLRLGWRNKELWAMELTKHFKETLCPDKVARKWCTLVEGYKKVKDNNNSTGKAPMCFQFYKEMDDLLGAQHDVVYPVVGTVEGLDVRRPEALVHSETASTSAATTSQTTATISQTTTSTASISTPPETPTTPKRPRKWQRDDDILTFLREAEVANWQRHEASKAQVMSAQQDYKSLIRELMERF